MKTPFAHHVLAALLGVVFTAELHAQSTAFTYQGRLQQNGSSATGTYDVRFILYDADFDGSQIGSILTNAVTVQGGLFTTTLDFGPVHDGMPFWLELHVRTNGATSFTPLSPRQPLAATPKAHYATEAGVAVTVASIPVNSVGTANLQAGSVTDSILADGAALAELADNDGSGSGLDADLLDGLSSASFWQLAGNAGTTPGTDFLGTVDNQSLEFRVNNLRVLQFLTTRSNEVFNVVAGSHQNHIDPDIISATIAGGGTPDWLGAPRTNSVNTDFATIGGGAGNRIGTNSNSGVIAGGFGSTIHDNTFDGTISGGAFQSIGTNAFASTIGGGNSNGIRDNAHRSTIGGGNGNVIETNSYISTLGGGFINRIRGNANRSTISGGSDHEIGFGSLQSTIGGGFNNAIMESSYRSTISGGSSHIIGSNSWYSTIAGGYQNLIFDNASLGIIGGGERNEIRAGSWRSIIGGGFLNVIEDEVQGGVVGGGLQNVISTNSDYAIVGGGVENVIGTNSFRSIIGGGQDNRIGDNSSYAVLGGGLDNQITENADVSFIAGGSRNRIYTNASYGSIGGGYTNVINFNADYGVISGGRFNTIHAGAQFAAIGGGFTNEAGANEATVAGGAFNRALGFSSAIGGGGGHQALGSWANVPGGRDNNAAADYAFAAGRQAKALHTGAFVWADSIGVDFPSVTANEFAVRAGGGARFETAGAGLTVDGAPVLAGTVGSAQLANGSVTESKLATGAVSSSKLANDSVLSASIADNAVTSEKVVDSLALGDSDNNGALSVFDADIDSAGVLLSGGGASIRTFGSDGLEQIRLWGPSWGELYLNDNVGNDSTVILSATSNSGGRMTLSDENGGDQIRLYGDLSGSARIGIGRVPNGNELEVEGSASKSVAGSWLANSDRRIKQEIEPVTNALEIIDRVELVSFRYTDDYRSEHAGVGEGRYLNVVAQDFAEVFPDHVKGSGEHLSDGSEILQVDTYPLTIYSAAAVQELHRKLKAEESRLAELERQNAELLGRLERLERLVN